MLEYMAPGGTVMGGLGSVAVGVGLESLKCFQLALSVSSLHFKT